MNAIFAVAMVAGQGAIPPVSPDQMVRACLLHADAIHQRAVKAGLKSDPNLPFLRFVTWHAVPPKLAAKFKILGRFVVNTASTDQKLVSLADVPGTDGLVQAIDIRDPRWSARSAGTVFRREPLFREPLLDHSATEALRRLLEIPQDADTLHGESIVWGPWLMREILESERSPSYLDLLYSAERFPSAEQKPWPGGVWPGDKRHYPAGAFEYKPQLDFVDFPKTEEDWELKWGIKAANDHFRKQKLSMKNGEIVAGAQSDPKNGSYVAYQDRVIIITPVAGGVALETYDGLKTAGDRDFIEDPENVVLDRLKADGGELLVTLPNKLQAALLINGKKERVEAADARLARNTRDPRSVVVRTQIGCITCHAPEGGIVSPSNRQFLETFGHGGAVRKIRDRETARVVDAFFLEWEDQLKEMRAPYLRAIQKCTTTVAEPKGWTPTQLVAAMLEFRNWYDDPVTPEQAAAELGITPVQLRAVCSQSVKTRLIQLAVGKPIPRSVWETDTLREVSLLLDASRGDDPDPLKRLLKPALIEKALDKGTK